MKVEERIWRNYNDLGNVALSCGRLQFAERMYLCALEEGSRFTVDEQLMCRSWAGIAHVYHRLAKPRLAMHYFRKTVQFYERSGADCDPHLAGALENLAGLHLQERAYAQARTLARKALSIYERILGEDNPILVPKLLRLALIYAEWKCPAKADEYLGRAKRLAILSKSEQGNYFRQSSE